MNRVGLGLAAIVCCEFISPLVFVHLDHVCLMQGSVFMLSPFVGGMVVGNHLDWSSPSSDQVASLHPPAPSIHRNTGDPCCPL